MHVANIAHYIRTFRERARVHSVHPPVRGPALAQVVGLEMVGLEVVGADVEVVDAEAADVEVEDVEADVGVADLFRWNWTEDFFFFF